MSCLLPRRTIGFVFEAALPLQKHAKASKASPRAEQRGVARWDKRESSNTKRVSRLTKKMGALFTRKVKVRPDGRQNRVTWSMWCSTFVNAEAIIVYSIRQGQIISFSSVLRYHVYRVSVKNQQLFRETFFTKKLEDFCAKKTCQFFFIYICYCSQSSRRSSLCPAFSFSAWPG